ncbi:MAG TPA: GspE/PulE family protein [Aquabacterium sp.]|nr:GspE/PulE family protein [Aquabacterium sp.]
MSTASPSFAELMRQLELARGQARASGRAVLDVLDEAGVAQAVCAASGVEVVRDGDVVLQTAEPIAGLPSQTLAPLQVRLAGGRCIVLMADPWNEDEVNRIARLMGSYAEPAAAPSSVLSRHGGPHSPPGGQGVPPSPAEPVAVDGRSDVVSFVDRVIAAAMKEGASDVHFECDRAGVTAKLRLDGVMTPLNRMEGRQRAEEVISRIKVLAQLDITERRLPQDGRFRHVTDGGGLDLRVSIMPSVFGEDAVLRLLDKSHLRAASDHVTLAALGFSAGDAKRIRLLSTLPNGMVLVTGPTGSGKTTTVYAAMSEIYTGQEKIITIEDPVEYELQGVLQIPVNERKGLTFARGLRSILRHDPDRILVGEIRDAETAEIAVQAALTGHLVFTTVHANSLFDVTGRFRHFGIDMFGFVSSLNGLVVQRLMRRLCRACMTERKPSVDEMEWLAGRGVRDLSVLPAAVGCEQCHRTGYRGRFVIAEVHQVQDDFRDRVMNNADVTEMKRTVFNAERRPLVDLAIDKVRGRETSLEELFRVVGQV